MSVQGAARHQARLAKMLRAAGPELGKAIYVAADAIRVEAKRSITAGSVSGRGHVASSPGEPPNRDTGHLDTNIEAAKTGPLEAETRSTASYAAALEFGTSKMAERPYMRPAVKKVMPLVRRQIGKTVEAIVKRS